MVPKNIRGVLLLCFVSIIFLQLLSPTASAKFSFGRRGGGGRPRGGTRIPTVPLTKVPKAPGKVRNGVNTAINIATRAGNKVNKAVNNVNKAIDNVGTFVDKVNGVIDNARDVADKVNQMFGGGNGGACDLRGTLRTDGDQCVCKANVEGPRCDRCKGWHFYLSHNAADGCIECECGNVEASGCTTVKRAYTEAFNLMANGQVTDINENSLGISVRRLDTSLVTFSNGFTEEYKSIIYFPISGSTQSFWHVDLSAYSFLDSYGSYIFLDVISCIPSALNETGIYNRPKIILVTNSGTRIANSDELNDPNSVHLSRGWFHLVESSWHYLPSNVRNLNDYYVQTPVASRLDMLNILVDLKSVMIRSSGYYPNHDGEFQLNFAEWPISSLSNEGEESLLEECQCNEGYDGPLCAYCAPGYVSIPVAGDNFICSRNPSK